MMATPLNDPPSVGEEISDGGIIFCENIVSEKPIVSHAFGEDMAFIGV